MSTIGIIDVFDRIKPSKGDYCKICFRTSSERKLVTPVFFLRFLRTVNILNTAYKTDIKVCYVCEHLATSAIKFYKAVLLGIDMDEVFGLMQQPGIRGYVLNNLTSGIKNSTKMYRAFKCETQYQKHHDSVPYSLKCTNTLLVNIENDDSKATMGSLSTQTPTDNDAILVLDGDLPPLTPIRPPQPVRVDPNQHTLTENQLMLHPMVTGADGRLYVPSLKLQMNDNEFQMVTESVIHKNITPQTQVLLSNRKIEQLTMGTDYEDFIRKRTGSTNKEMITTEGMHILLNFDDCESENKKSRYETDPSHVSNDNGLYVNNIGPSNEKHDASYVNKGVKMKDDKEKRPLLSMGRVDWEDKIPMDVISFIDASDPNPGERIMQPNTPALGRISDVRSIETTEEQDVQIIDNVECIDLC